MTRRRFRVFIAPTAALAITLMAVPQALAQPVNDDFANAAVITSLPFSDSVEISAATTEPGEPSSCGPTNQTIWYSFTPSSDVAVRADTSGSDFTPNELGLYQQVGSGFSLALIGCVFDGNPIQVLIEAGNTYYFQVGSFTGGASGNLRLNVQAPPPPPNDNFADATTFTNVPFSDSFDMAGATNELGEPTPSCSGPAQGTVWYAFTPTASGSYFGGINTTNWIAQVAVYTGSSLGTLSEVHCALGNPLVFLATAGTTYYIQIGNHAGLGGPAQFTFDLAPPPIAQFGFAPTDPSVFDSITFFDNSFDPVGAGFTSRDWDFGDGETATDPFCCVTHRYAADGDYTVELTVTTTDGRTASTSQVVSVRTHDVAIAKFFTPTAASAGQTRTITVGVTNHRYPEVVEVQLFKSIPGVGGFELLNALTQPVSVLPGNRITTFAFSYTFTIDDAAVGKVTFKAIATIINARDALPGDNERIAAPTKVV
jgi:PKD repeat protein